MKILLVKTSSLGDVVHNLPVASDIRARFPQARIDWVVEEGFADIPRLHPAVSRVIPVAVRRWRRALLSAATWRELRAYRDAVRAEAYDLVLDTQGLIKSALLARQARGKRAGYAAEAAREPLAARFYDAAYVIPKNLHAVERNRWLAAAAFGYEPNLPLDYGIAAAPLAAPWLPAAPYCVLPRRRHGAGRRRAADGHRRAGAAVGRRAPRRRRRHRPQPHRRRPGATDFLPVRRLAAGTHRRVCRRDGDQSRRRRRAADGRRGSCRDRRSRRSGFSPTAGAGQPPEAG